MTDSPSKPTASLAAFSTSPQHRDQPLGLRPVSLTDLLRSSFAFFVIDPM
ncbi:hypothetical protein [Streptomyces sp. NPDC056255]